MPRYKLTYGTCDGLGPFEKTVYADSMANAVYLLGTEANVNNMTKCELVPKDPSCGCPTCERVRGILR